MANATNAKQQPTHAVFHVVGEDKKKSRWQRIGAGWAHQDGEGMNIVLEYLPVTPGRLVIRVPKQRDAAA